MRHGEFWVLAHSFPCCHAERFVAPYKNGPFSCSQQPLWDTELSILTQDAEERGYCEQSFPCSWEKVWPLCSREAEHKSEHEQLIAALTLKKGSSAPYVTSLSLFL